MIIVDIETTGLSPAQHSMVSLGAVDYDTGEEFYGECRAYSGRKIDAFALGVNGFTEARCLDETKDSPHGLYKRFLEWAVADAKRDLLLGGQQVGAFDVLFLKEVAGHPDLDGIVPSWPFGYRTVDLHSVAYAKLGKSLSLDGILQTVGLSPEPKPHNALTGARLERDAFKLLLA